LEPVLRRRDGHRPGPLPGGLWRPGARLAGQAPFDWSVGLEYRRETLRLSNNWGGPGLIGDRTVLDATQNRPWALVRVGHTFPGAGVQPFLAASVGAALSQAGADGKLGENLVKALAPRTELALQAGLRF